MIEVDSLTKPLIELYFFYEYFVDTPPIKWGFM